MADRDVTVCGVGDGCCDCGCWFGLGGGGRLGWVGCAGCARRCFGACWSEPLVAFGALGWVSGVRGFGP